MEAKLRPAALMGVKDIHRWARSIGGVPKAVADAFGGQCFLEDVDGPTLLSLTPQTLHTELGVEREYVVAVQAAIELLRRGGAASPPRTKSLREAFEDLLVVPPEGVPEGVPPPSPASMLGFPAIARPPPSPYGVSRRSPRAAAEPEPQVDLASPDTTLSSTAEEHVASLESDERAVLDAAKGKAALERRLRATEHQGKRCHHHFFCSMRRILSFFSERCTSLFKLKPFVNDSHGGAKRERDARGHNRGRARDARGRSRGALARGNNLTRGLGAVERRHGDGVSSSAGVG